MEMVCVVIDDNLSSEGSEHVKQRLELAIERERLAAENRKVAHAEWVEAAIELAAAMAAARDMFPANLEFHDWLDANAWLDRFNKDDRAALIQIGHLARTEMAVVREVLGETGRRSFQLIWSEELRPRLAPQAVPKRGGVGARSGAVDDLADVLAKCVARLERVVAEGQLRERMEALLRALDDHPGALGEKRRPKFASRIRKVAKLIESWADRLDDVDDVLDLEPSVRPDRRSLH
jgi:hypothetical protein